MPAPRPLHLTAGRFYNDRRPAKDRDGESAERWIKKLAHSGKLTQFEYGTDTPAGIGVSDDERHPGGLQRCIICTYGTRVFVIDVDYPDEFAATRTARLAGRDRAMSTRGDGFHVLVDGRGVPESHWPRKVPIAGADIISNGFVPVPGSVHYSGQRYEPADAVAVRVTPELLAAIRADQAACKASGGGSGGSGGGHDGEVAAHVLGWLRQAVNAGRDPADPAVKEEIYQRWLTVAVAQDPGWPFERQDFEKRHYRTAVQTIAEDPGPDLPPGFIEWALRHGG